MLPKELRRLGAGAISAHKTLESSKNDNIQEGDHKTYLSWKPFMIFSSGAICKNQNAMSFWRFLGLSHPKLSKCYKSYKSFANFWFRSSLFGNEWGLGGRGALISGLLILAHKQFVLKSFKKARLLSIHLTQKVINLKKSYRNQLKNVIDFPSL